MSGIFSSSIKVCDDEKWNTVEKITRKVLEVLGEHTSADRSYLFHIRGEQLYNTHEWVRQRTGVEPFQNSLYDVQARQLPYFTSELRANRLVFVRDISSLEKMDPPPTLEIEELIKEKITRLLLVPIPNYISKDAVSDTVTPKISIGGFIGIDFCDGNENLPSKKHLDDECVEKLENAGRFIFLLHVLAELITEQSLILENRDESVFKPRDDYKIRKIAEIYGELCELAGTAELPSTSPNCSDWSCVTDTQKEDNSDIVIGNQIMERVSQLVQDILLSNLPRLSPKINPDNSSIPNALSVAIQSFQSTRFAHINSDVWIAGGITESELEDFKKVCAMRWGEMMPDIEPYTCCRDVGYARYMYRFGSLYTLKHKAFFQTKPEYNAVVGSTPRPFNRMADDVRESPVLKKMLQILLEQIWANELGPEVHIGVHPVRVRNFEQNGNGEFVIHDKAQCTLEGTHVDSTERVVVMMIERNNVAEGYGKTSLYHASCPFGMMRTNPNDEKIIGPLRLREIELKEPFEAITFDDTNFKHDGSTIFPADKDALCWRSVLLIMCRRPLTVASPLDGRVIDGYSPKSPRKKNSRN